MGNFFSLLSSGDGKIYCFTPEMRLNYHKDNDYVSYVFDSYYNIAYDFQINEDECNKWEWDVIDNWLTLHTQNNNNDRAAVLDYISKIDFKPILGDLDELRKSASEFLDVNWMKNNPGLLPNNVPIRMFQSSDIAYRAVIKAMSEHNSMGWPHIHLVSTRHEKTKYIYKALQQHDNEQFNLGRLANSQHSHCLLIPTSSKHSFGMAVSSHICCEALKRGADIGIVNQKYADVACAAWQVWKAGYGVKDIVNGRLYCYEKISD